MKITNIECYPVWGGFRNFLFVVVDTDEGIYGVGEAGITGRELAVMGAIEHFKPLLIGQDPMRIEHIWQVLFRGGFFPAQRILTSAIAAIDIALWDILGKVAGLPVYRLLGGAVRDFVTTKFSVSGLEPPQAAALAAWAVDQGFRTMKVKVGIDPDQDVARVRAVREKPLGRVYAWAWMPMVAGRLGWRSKPLEMLIDYAVLIYGRDRLPVLLAALPHHHRWETLIPAVFHVSAAEFERGWQAALRARYHLPNDRMTPVDVNGR